MVNVKANRTSSATSSATSSVNAGAEADSANAAAQVTSAAPHEDDARKPDSPSDIRPRSWKFVLRKTLREFSSDQCTDIAASLTYFAVLSIFPALIAIVSVLGLFGDREEVVKTILSLVGSIAPGSSASVIRGPLEALVSSPAAGFALVSGIVVSIWTASGYVGAFTRAMNRIYEIDEGRPFLRLKPMQLLVTVTGIVLILLMLAILIVSGPVTDAVGRALGLGPVVQLLWGILKWPLLAAILVLAIAILYYATPNAKQPKFRWLSLGALLAVISLVVVSLLFGLYVSNFSSYDKNYGSLAGVIIFLLWLWLANLALLLGAEFDAELERGRQLQAGIKAEEELQLPPRDTKKSEKVAAKERLDAAEGRTIREQSEVS